DYSPLVKDTQDYVTGIAKYDGDTYYILSCGAKVPLSYEDNNGKGSKTKVTDVAITEGYIMPPNTIRLVSCESNDGEAVMKFDLNRKVPFIARLTGQSYSDYKVGRKVAVSESNATGLQIVFYDTVSAKGSFSFTDTVIRNASFSVKNKTATLSIGFKAAGRFYGYHYEYDKDGYLILSFKKKPASLKGAVVMLDPGHGGGDSGAVCVATSSAFKGEKDINLAIAKTVKSILEDKGASVIMTRTSDKFVSLTERTEMCHKYNPDLFISIHCDSASSSSSRGTSAYYYRAYSQPLAKSIHSSLVNTYKANIYGSNDSAISKGTSFYAFRVERVEECPSVLIEYGFVSNLRECSLLQNSTVRYSLAQATVNGIEKYIKNQ
ncbi:MAG: N-acetylmuramoyl-L-alanine amidase, partial [Clostridiales bacterium]|nr:N-acetylmuramoyl-L-alanine amidase [Clostridiales bacterium]